MSNHALLLTLREMLAYARPHGSIADWQFRARYLLDLPHARIDDHGNIIVRVNDDPILWSAHTDTVARVSGRQDVVLTDEGILKLTRRARKTSACLGADDTAGCFILREMITRGIGGTYVFHYGEERGGIGSSALALHDRGFLDAFQYAIALDRAHHSDVITHQASERTASDAFAQSIADHLDAHGLHYAPCDSGIYTDTVEYADVIPECSNLSVGYEHAHSPRETLDGNHTIALLDALCELSAGDLTCERDPQAIDPEDWPVDDDDDPIDRDRALYLDDEQRRVQNALERLEQDTRYRLTRASLRDVKGPH